MILNDFILFLKFSYENANSSSELIEIMMKDSYFLILSCVNSCVILFQVFINDFHSIFIFINNVENA